MASGSIEPVKDMRRLRGMLERDMPVNAQFVRVAFVEKENLRFFCDDDCTRAIAINRKKDYAVFGGDWSRAPLPFDLLSEKGFFVSACPPAAMNKLKAHYKIKGEWPCWSYVRGKGFGKGQWDSLGGLRPSDAKLVARYWKLDDNPVPYIRSRIRKYDSACVRIDGKPVAWGGLHFVASGWANMGFAHVLGRHRRKGLGTLVTKAMVNKIVAKGHHPYMIIFKTNKKSQALARKCGFRREGEVAWAQFGRRKKINNC